MLLVAKHFDLLLGLQVVKKLVVLQLNQKYKLVELLLMSQLGQALQLLLGAELCMGAYRASFDLIMIPSTRYI